MTAKTWFPLAVVGLALLWVGAKAVPRSPASGEMDLDAFGRLPAQFQGRFMPIDTVARHHLLIISGGRQTYHTGEEGTFGPKSDSATKWYLEVVSGKERANDYKVIRVDNPEVRQTLRLEKRPGSWRYSRAEVAERLAKQRDDLKKALDKANADKALTEYEKALLSTRSNVVTIGALHDLNLPGLIPDPDHQGLWLSPMEVDRQNAPQFRTRAIAEAERLIDERIAQNPAKMAQARQQMGEEQFEAMLDEIKQEAAVEHLKKLLDEHRAEFAPQSAAFHRILNAYADNKVDEFNEAVHAYHDKYVGTLTDSEAGTAKLEFFLNRFEPFFVCQWLYFGVLVMAALSWLWWTKPLNNAATALGLFALALHTTGLIMRIVVSGKPPVTNLYSSAVFIGWGGLILCLALDLYYRNGLGNFVGGLIGMCTMMIAKFLESNGDTMPKVEAVLNTNFWLSSHVTLVTLGYTATFVAGHLGVFYLIAGLFTKKLSKVNEASDSVKAAPVDRGRIVYGMMYGVTCFATLLSFVGTVLGGFWADDSWGRFWGWDPKENGAVLIVMWNTLNLHLRWGGLVKARGFAVMAVFGNVITAWSWFGTNQLGIGLHAYGFDDKLATGVALYWVSQFCVAALGFVPLKYWASFGPTTAKAA